MLVPKMSENESSFIPLSGQGAAAAPLSPKAGAVASQKKIGAHL